MTTKHKPIMVLGLPSGGTSAVAALLDALGVHMGDLRRMEPGAGNHRPYATYECAALRNIVDGNRADWRQVAHGVCDYVRGRTWASTSDRRLGFKHPALCHLGHIEPEHHEFLDGCDIVNVIRPLRETQARNRYYRQINTDAYMVHMNAGRDELCRIHEPVHEIRFGLLREMPEHEVRAMAEALNLDPTEDEVAEAVERITGYEKPDGPNLNVRNRPRPRASGRRVFERRGA